MARGAFQQLVGAGKLQLQKGENLADAEMLFSIIVKERQRVMGRRRSDEKIALISLCWLLFPGKTPQYRTGVLKFRLAFRGISTDKALQDAFVKTLSSTLILANSAKMLRMRKVEDTFKLPASSIPPRSAGIQQLQRTTRTQLIEALAKKSGLPKVKAHEAIDAIFNAERGIISAELAAGRRVTLPGFGTFSVRRKAARTHYSVAAGRSIRVPAARTASFKAGKTLKNKIMK